VASLLPGHTRRYDLVLCDFGALNTAGAASTWGPVVARLLKPDGRLVATVMNRWCLAEIAASLLRLRPSFALRRWRGEPISVGGVPLTTKLYSAAEFARSLKNNFEQETVRGLCVALPPPTLEASFPALTRNGFVQSAERLLGRLPLLRGLGDHFLTIMKPRMGGYTLFETGAPITASPVVSDLNGDGEQEVVVAADRLWLLDRTGSPLYGWPRRASKPMASTPLVLREGDSARIYAGSDDHRLYGFNLTGKKLANFPFPTRGDVFSSPWTGALDGDGQHAIAFGSDDGLIYMLDEAGKPKPGWPVQTDGYVSASVSAARSQAGTALFIGSWDGKLYGLDGQGAALPGWPRHIGFPIWGTAAVADIDGDGFADVIVAAHKLFAMRGNGDAMPGFPVPLGGYVAGSPAIGDIDGDGRPEIVVASDRVYAFRANGRLVEGFPVEIGAYVWSSPLLVDVNGDGRADVVVADMSGRVWAIDGRGNVIDGWPRKAGQRIAATSAAADLDGDGYLELLVATWEGKVVVYSTEARADDTAASPWRTFPNRFVPPEPLFGGSPHDPQLAAEESPEAEFAALDVDATVWLEPGRPLPFRVTDVHLSLWGGQEIEAGLLLYSLNGRMHPSPLLGRDGRYFGIVQPLPPLKTIDMHFELLGRDGRRIRVPQGGAYRMRIGASGVSRTDA
jgi:hypothetical protein